METYMSDTFAWIQCPGKVRGFIEESYRVSGSDAKGAREGVILY